MRRVLKRGLAVFLIAVLLLSVPGGPDAAAAAAESGSRAICEAASAVSRGVAALTGGTSDASDVQRNAGTVYVSLDGTWQISFDKSSGNLGSFHANDGFRGSVTIPDKIEGVDVQSIGSNTFYSCTPLTSITLPDTLTSIQMSAFDGCANLASVTLGSGLRTIGSYAFADCYGLTNLVLPDTVTQIEAWAFLRCTSLTSITLPDSLTSLGSGAFSGCDNLTSAGLAKSKLTRIETNTFDRCRNLASVTLPASLTGIGAYAFSGCAITELTLSAGLTTLGEGAFTGCESLTYADLSASQLTGIETHTFSGCPRLERVSLPANLTGIGAYAFSECAITELTLPAGLTNLGEGAFSGCGNLTGMTLPNGVTTLGEEVFSDCSSLASVSLPSGLTDIGASAFENCGQLVGITLPNNLAAIGTSAFKNCVRLTGITLPGSLTGIGDTAFYGCSALTSIRLPASLSSIGDSAFGGCSALCCAYVFSDNVVFSYDVFPVNEGFLLYCHAGSTAEQYAKTNGLQYVLIEGEAERILQVTVVKPDGTALTEGYTVSWYLGTGESPVGTGTTLTNAIVGRDYEVQVELSDELAALYEQPGRLAMEADTMEIRLQEREAAKEVSLRGMVTALDGTPRPGVQVTASGADFSGRSGQSADDGTFTLEVPASQMEVALSKTGYYSRRFTLDLSDRSDGAVEELGALLLVETEASHIDLRLTLQYAAGDGELPLRRSLTTAEGYTVTLSHADGSSIRGAELRGLTLVFPPQSVMANETLTLTVESRDGTTAPARVSVQLDENCVGAAEITLCQRGSITCGAIAPAGADLLLFGTDGQLVQLNAAVSSFQSEPLAAGSYTVVLIQSSPLLRGISSLEMLDHLGLEAADYVKRSVAVTDSRISDLGEIMVPQPDEGAITVTDSSATYLSSNRSQVALGGLFLVEAGFRLREDYSELPSSLQFHLPQGIQVVEGSVTLDGAVSRYEVQDGVLSVPLAGRSSATVLRAAAVLDGMYSDTIRLVLTVKTEQPGGSTGGGTGSGASSSGTILTDCIGHGTITVTPSRACKGETVIITVVPDDGYELNTLVVTGQNGAPVELRSLGGGTYTFLMPAGNATVRAGFTEAAEPGCPFADVEPGDYFYDAVAWAVENGITSGTSETAFSPDVVCTRAQAVTFLWRAAGSPQSRSDPQLFRDVWESDYYYQAVLWAVENGITAGTSPDTFSPDAACTRSQVVTFLYRYDGSKATEKISFADVSEDAYYYDAVQWAAQSGITAGTGPDVFSPDAGCTRAQIVTLLYRALKE